MKRSKDWFDRTLEHNEDGNYSQALVAISKYVEEHPGNKNGKLLQALVYRELSSFDKSLELLRDIVPGKEDSQKYSLLYFREMADTYKALGNFSEAIKWLDKIIQAEPEHSMGYILKGSCLAVSGNYEAARAEHLKATRMEGDPEEAYYNLALIARAEMQFEEAREYCEKSLAIDPDDQQVIHCYKDILMAIEMLQQERSQ